MEQRGRDPELLRAHRVCDLVDHPMTPLEPKRIDPPSGCLAVDVDHYLDVRKPAFEPWERSGAISYQPGRGYSPAWIAITREAAAALPEITVKVETAIKARR